MRSTRTVKIMAVIFSSYALLVALDYFWPSLSGSSIGPIVAGPFLLVYIFHGIGIPGLLENNGACGSGWCSPTLLGWLFLSGFWLLVVWLVARVIAQLTKTSN